MALRWTGRARGVGAGHAFSLAGGIVRVYGAHAGLRACPTAPKTTRPNPPTRPKLDGIKDQYEKKKAKERRV